MKQTCLPTKDELLTLTHSKLVKPLTKKIINSADVLRKILSTCQ